MKDTPYMPSHADLEAARRAFLERETRDLFYRAATQLVEQSLSSDASLSLAEALAVLLQTWNASYYRYRRFDATHFDDIERLLLKHERRLRQLRDKQIEDVSDCEDIAAMFEAFEEVLGPVGAAKALHLLCPCFFPLWDRAIAHAYGIGLGPSGTNGQHYCNFMAVCQTQCESLADGDGPPQRGILKRLDEFNYCRYTKKWI